MIEDLINSMFKWCMDGLYTVSVLTGISYEAINVLLFLIINPIFILLLILYVIYLKYKIKNSVHNEGIH